MDDIFEREDAIISASASDDYDAVFALLDNNK